MNLSVKDVAGLLNVSEKTIYRMIKNETIPCFRVGGQWRFDKREIVSWMEDTRAFSYETAAGRSGGDEAGSISVAEFLRRGGIYYDVPGETKEDAISSCLELIKAGIPAMDTRRLFSAILERETLCSTAVGHGVAIPHPRSFSMTAALSCISLCYLKRPIPFGALDNEDVDTLFFIFPRSERRFLIIQTKLLRLMKDEDIMSTVKRAAPADEIYAVFTMKEDEIFRGAVK